VLARLLQLYQHDFSEIEGGELGDDGLYPYVDLDRWLALPHRYPYLIRVDGKLAGFVLVTEHEPDGYEIAEFFVVRKYRRRGVGAQAARSVFDRHSGRWHLSQTRNNDAARAFWRRVIGAYTGGQFEESAVPHVMYPATTQRFDTRSGKMTPS
jgi:predicted acetyltransferase